MTTHAIDGVFTERDDGTLSFHALRPPARNELRVLVSVIRHEVLRYAVRNGLLDEDAVPDLDAPALATLVAASMHNLRALGPQPGAPVQRLLGIDPEIVRRPRSRFAVHYDGFDPHAGLSVRARTRKVLELAGCPLRSRFEFWQPRPRAAHFA